MDINIRRGIDFQNRVWDSGIGRKFKTTFNWWSGGPINKITFLGLFAVFFLNIFIVSAVFNKNLTPSFSYSAFLVMIADTIEHLGLLDKSSFFSLLSVVSLSIAPISVYLFTRRIIHRHELSAFIATLLFVVPSPISKDGMPLIQALLSGDGAHAVVFAYIPLFLLYFKAFIRSGFFIWGLFSAVGTTLIALTSPFAFFNVLFFFLILTISEGFMGGFRVKIARFLFVIASTIGLSYFWYYPNTITKILLLESVQFATSYFLKVFPLLIPTIPVIGAISFLVFDRREKLQPIFIGAFLFGIYLALSSLSSSFNVTGIFVSDRYSPELSFCLSFLIALTLGILFDFLYQKAKDFIVKKDNPIYSSVFFFGFIACFIAIFAVSFINAEGVRDDIASIYVAKQHSLGVGSIERSGLFSNVSSILSSLVSILTLALLLYILKYYPPVPKSDRSHPTIETELPKTQTIP